MAYVGRFAQRYVENTMGSGSSSCESDSDSDRSDYEPAAEGRRGEWKEDGDLDHVIDQARRDAMPTQRDVVKPADVFDGKSRQGKEDNDARLNVLPRNATGILNYDDDLGVPKSVAARIHSGSTSGTGIQVCDFKVGEEGYASLVRRNRITFKTPKAGCNFEVTADEDDQTLRVYMFAEFFRRIRFRPGTGVYMEFEPSYEDPDPLFEKVILRLGFRPVKITSRTRAYVGRAGDIKRNIKMPAHVRLVES